MTVQRKYFLWQVFRAGSGPLLWLKLGYGFERKGIGIELVFDGSSCDGRIMLLPENYKEIKTEIERRKK